MNFSKDILKVLKLYILANIFILSLASISVELYLNGSDQVTQTAQHKISSAQLLSDSSNQLFITDKTRESLASSSVQLVDVVAKSSSLQITLIKLHTIIRFDKNILRYNNTPILNQSRAPPLS